jgi:hypothetical protein
MDEEAPLELREASASPDVFGRRTPLYESIAAGIRRHGVALCELPHALPESRGTDSARIQLVDGVIAAADAVVVIVDRMLVESFFSGDQASRVERQAKRRLASCASHACELVTEAAIALAARRLVAVCDLRGRTADERARAIQWLRRSLHRIGYECSINGLHGIATTYAVVASDTDVARTACLIVSGNGGSRRCEPARESIDHRGAGQVAGDGRGSRTGICAGPAARAELHRAVRGPDFVDPAPTQVGIRCSQGAAVVG